MKEKSAGCGRGMWSVEVRPGQGVGGKQHKYAGTHTALAGEVYIVYTRSVGPGPWLVLLLARVAPKGMGGDVGVSKAATLGLVGPGVELAPAGPKDSR